MENSQCFQRIEQKYVLHRQVYHRLRQQLAEAENYLYHGGHPKAEILREVDYLRQFYGELRPAAWIGYARIALAGLEDPALRITFDWDLRWRNEDMYLNDNQTGRRLLPEQQHLMEIKVPGAMPLWLVHILGQLEIYPVSFSKYGTAYQQSVALGAVNREADILLPNGVKKGMMICA